MIDPIELIAKYYDKDTELYRLLLLHSMQVRDKALETAARHPELGADTQFLTEASMLHDIGIYLCHAPGIFCEGTHKYIEHGYLGADILRKEGLEHHALVCERHTGSGLTLANIIKNKLPLPHRDMVPVSVEEQIICYADKFYSKSKPHKTISPDEIVQMLANFGEEEAHRFRQWHQLFG